MKKLVISIVAIMVSVMCMMTYSYAAGAQLQAKIEITPSATEVKAGDEVVFTFTTKNIVNAESGKIYAIGGKIVYDTAFFEECSGDMTYEESTGLFNSTKPVSEGQSNGKITLKVKADATGSGEVKFTELTASDGRLEDMETLGAATTLDVKFTISIKQKTEDEQKPPVDDGNQGDEQKPPVDDGNQGGEQKPPVDDNENKGEKPTTQGTTVVVGEDKDKDKTTSRNEIPKAGASTMVVASLIIATVVAIVINKKNQKYKDI